MCLTRSTQLFCVYSTRAAECLTLIGDNEPTRCVFVLLLGCVKDNGVKSIIRSGRSGGRTGLCVSASAGRGDRRALAHLLGLLKSATSLDLHLRKDTFKMYPQGRHPVSNIHYIDALCSGISAQERVYLLHL